MSAPDPRWPDAVQRLAIEAATADLDVAVAAWRQLVSQVRIEDLWDDEVYRLLPLVWSHLGAEVGPEHRDLLKGLYRRSWVQNQHHVRHGADLVRRLGEAGIDSIVLKGLAVSLLFHRDLGARPMGDVDVMVRPEHGVAAWRLLEGLGYQPVPIRMRARSRWERPTDDDEWYLCTRHARGYRRDRLDEVDLHTTIDRDFLGDDPAVSATDDFWAAAVPLEVGGVATQTLSPTHHLLHTILHGVEAFDVTTLRWIPDSLAILRDAGDDLDWQELTATADRHRCQLFVGEGLAHLAEAWDAPVPPDVVTHLRPGVADRRQHAVRWVRRRAGNRFPMAGNTTSLYLTTTRGRGPFATIARGPAFLEDHWQVDHRRHLPLVAAHKLDERTRHFSRVIAGKVRARRTP